MEPNLQLLSRRDDIGIGTIELTRASFSPTRQSSSLSPEMANALIEYAEFKDLFPPSISLSTGRSLYAKSDRNSNWAKANIPGIKAKGIAGLAPARGGHGYLEAPDGFVITDGFKYVISPPMHENAFIMSDRVHIAITEKLRLVSKISALKFWFSLTKDGAEKEYDCQASLAKNGLGFGALSAGAFIHKNGQPELDGLQRPVGGVFLIHNPEAKLVSRYSHFSVFKTESGELKVFKPSETRKQSAEASGKLDLSDLIENYIYFATRMAEVKAQGLFLAGVARHSSHDGNFWYLEHKDLVQMADNDTCLLLKDQPEEMHGIIVLRDYATYINRVMRQLALNSFDPAFFAQLASGIYRPVHRVLEALFKDLASLSDINNSASEITQGYIEFVFGKGRDGGPNTSELFKSALNFQRGISSIDATAKNTYFSDEARMQWEIAHVPFNKTIILELYKLWSKSRLPEKGFKLPNVDLQVLEANLQSDLEEIIKIYKQEFAIDMKRNRGEDI